MKRSLDRLDPVEPDERTPEAVARAGAAGRALLATAVPAAST